MLKPVREALSCLDSALTSWVNSCALPLLLALSVATTLLLVIVTWGGEDLLLACKSVVEFAWVFSADDDEDFNPVDNKNSFSSDIEILPSKFSSISKNTFLIVSDAMKRKVKLGLCILNELKSKE